jgi:hypothetical protein
MASRCGKRQKAVCERRCGMINLGTFIICCALCLFAGILLGENTEHNRFKNQMEDLKNFYHENTNSLVKYIEKINGKKGGE